MTEENLKQKEKKQYTSPQKPKKENNLQSQTRTGASGNPDSGFSSS